MPLMSENPILKVELGSMHTIDTTNVENLFGLWSAFNKCSGMVEDGKRLENLSWRLWARESFCCEPEHQSYLSRWSFSRRKHQKHHSPSSAPTAIPELSSSVDSTTSSLHMPAAIGSCSEIARPELRRTESTRCGSRKEKHITPTDLEKIVFSIKEKKELEPLSPLPFPPSTITLATLANTRNEESTPRMASPPQQPVPDSSTSTIATAALSSISDMSPSAGSETSASSEMSSTSIVRGFKPSTSTRSSTNLAPVPAPILKNSSSRNLTKPTMGKKGAKFTLGGSSGENDSSLETRYMPSSITSDMYKKPNVMRKVTSFKAEVTTIQSKSNESDSAVESESAIETDEEDEDGEWEDEEEEEIQSSSPVDSHDFFRKSEVGPRANQLQSRPSLLTNLMHEKDRKSALQNLASRSTPALRRSRTSSPNGPSLAASPEDETVLEMKGTAIPRSRPTIITTTNTVHPPASTSPRTTRRLMLQQELPESLRKHMVWERQQRNKTNAAALKRRHTAHGALKDLKNYPGMEPRYNPSLTNLAEPSSSWNAYFDAGAEQEYHSKGW